MFLLANLGSLVVNYPYDDEREGKTQYSRSPDDTVFQLISKAYSQVTGHCCFCPAVISGDDVVS